MASGRGAFVPAVKHFRKVSVERYEVRMPV